MKSLFCHWKSPVGFEICDWWSSRTSVLLACGPNVPSTAGLEDRSCLGGCDGDQPSRAGMLRAAVYNPTTMISTANAMRNV